MKTNEARIADLESTLKRQGRTLDVILKKVALLEKENVRRRNDMAILKNERR
jgi:uncharacterized coiled-coil protein SlyX